MTKEAKADEAQPALAVVIEPFTLESGETLQKGSPISDKGVLKAILDGPHSGHIIRLAR